MLVISRRALLLFNFGVAIFFLAAGFVAAYALDVIRPNRLVTSAAFDAASLTAIAEEQDLDRLRSRTRFYFEVARDLRKTRTQDSEQAFHELRLFAFAVAALFALGGLLPLALPDVAPEEKAERHKKAPHHR